MAASLIARSWGNRPTPRRPQSRRSRPLVEVLEGRLLLTAQEFDVLKTGDYTATSTNLNTSTAVNTLRWAILESELAGNAGSTIDFKIPSTGVQIIKPLTTLPPITATVTINGLTQAGAGATRPMVVIDGTTATAADAGSLIGLELQASHSKISGLVIDHWGNARYLGLGGVVLDAAPATGAAASGDIITDVFIGVDATGAAAASNGNFPLRLNQGANHNTITGCVISDNTIVNTAPGGADAGVHINNGSYDNVFAGNMIGTDITGTKALGNAGSGVIIDSGSYGNTIGGTAPGTANVITGNKFDGVHIELAGDLVGQGNVVEGNMIGTDITGTKILTSDNGDHGVQIQQSDYSTIGGTTPGARNIIANSGEAGVEMDGGSSYNLVKGNDLGNAVYKGSSLLGNDQQGVLIQGLSDFNTIGGSTASALNVISGNQGDGVDISGSSFNLVDEDYVGADSTGGHVMGNRDGVVIEKFSMFNVVANSVLSGNAAQGLDIDSGSMHNLADGDEIGTDPTGEKPLGNGNSGVCINDSNDNTIGGGLSYNAGIQILSTNGTTVTGCTVEYNGEYGILVDGTTSGYTVTSSNIVLHNTVNTKY